MLLVILSGCIEKKSKDDTVAIGPDISAVDEKTETTVLETLQEDIEETSQKQAENNEVQKSEKPVEKDLEEITENQKPVETKPMETTQPTQSVQSPTGAEGLLDVEDGAGWG